MSKWYGNIANRLEEGRQFCEKITVGTGVTEYFYSDRHAYEVIEVKDQKHITIREYDHKHIGDAYENKWELISNPDNPSYELVKRGKNWYTMQECTLEDLIRLDNVEGEEKFRLSLWISHNRFDTEKIRATGKSQKRYHRKNISIGIADYYYDYEY